ncbi:solute carrier family 38 (sodium-coupled neutral amino acid transporter), member 11 [Cryptococcus neoformans]|nr:solute carrier family 38 (sodium-coupled neutral amino acid transporter), member 11 [Cryptococcus neoformans var. grubii c45]OXB38939.1 solute carrier family 38 (sodium-coupled neutral amino acid transporter), member 11 [Cryptococcus neoformans var. grubii]OXC63564.1 solute carrier family 38 (sodium-coupled neutral amino acid transporter), member 11 [Cryptococcus neoformans var. grubii MW-RSA852]
MALVDVEEQSTAGPSHSRSSSVLAATAAGSVSSSRRESRRNSKDREIRDGGRDGDDHVLFRAAEEDIELQDSATAPLLAGAAASPRLLESEEHHLLETEGHKAASRGSILDAVTNMANSIIGAGIVGLPYAVSQAGFVMGVFLLIALAAISDWTIRLVILTSKLSGRESYTETMYHCFGPLGAMAVSFFQFSFAFGGTAAFHVIVGDTIPRVISYTFPSFAEDAFLRLFVNRQAVIIMCTLFISFPLSLHRDIVKLSKSSSFALVSMVIIIVSVLFRSVAVDPSLRGSSSDVFSIVKPGIFQAIGVISFAYACHHNSNYIYKSINVPTLDRFNMVTHISTGISLIACLLVAVCGYVVFTDKTEGNILNNFSSEDWLINIARLCFGANMSTTIPLEVFVCREVLEETFYKSKPFSKLRHVIITSAVIFIAMALALTTCDLGVVLELAGGLSASALAFILPASAYFVMLSGPWSSRRRLPALLVAGFGMIVLVLSCGLSLKKAWSGEGGKSEC